MGKINQIRGVAGGVLGWFVGRNNDVDGYWAIGKLRSLSDSNSGSPVSIDLLAGTVTPVDSSAHKVAIVARTRILRLLEINDIATDKIGSATIKLEFNLKEISRTELPQTTRGAPYSCTISIKHISGKKFVLKRFGWCGPHDPTKESKRATYESSKLSFWKKLFG